MINIRTIRKLKENDGLTLKAGKIIRYKSGWQVADYGLELHTAEEAIKAVKLYKGNCGIWYAGGKRKLLRWAGHSIRFPSGDGKHKNSLIANRKRRKRRFISFSKC